MHGCPPDEIERIGRYLLEERGLHTVVKLNPTLLGKERVLGILHDDLGFTEIHIPDAVFEKDLKYDRAVELIRSLQKVAAARGLTFGVKLSNTLAMHNHRRVLPGEEMYMSGRPLYPVTMNLFARLLHEFNGDLRVSYSAGADALNIATIFSCGGRPVTACSDLLKPGGYARMVQWLENIETAMQERGAANLDEFAGDRLANVEQAAAAALADPRYKKSYHRHGLPKVESGLGLWDCVVAPCVEACAVKQDVPEYAWLVAQGDYDRALEVILARNPLPGVTGYVCTHLCQTKCTRNDYEEPVAIRALKRIATEWGNRRMANRESRIVDSEPQPAIGNPPSAIGNPPSAIGNPPSAIGNPPSAIGNPPSAIGNPQPAIGNPQPAIGNPQPAIGNPQSAIGNPQSAISNRQSAIGNPQPAIGNPQSAIGNPHRVAIIGAGPSGLAAAAFLAINGVQATIFEAKDVPGGMLRLVPPFRLPWEIIQEDIERITALGVEIVLNHRITVPPEELLRSPASTGKQGFDAVYIASGFQRDAALRIPGVEGPGVLPALRLLDCSRRGERVDLGQKAVVIGGGDTVMDAARTAQRFTGNPVTILYRRTRREMPAAEEELEGALEEGNVLEELVAPVRIIRETHEHVIARSAATKQSPANGGDCFAQTACNDAAAGKVLGIECVRNRLGEPGPDGRREPVAIPGSEFIVPCDSVIVAVGQLPELAFLDGSQVRRHKGGGVLVDEATGCAGPEGIYAGGDVVIKPASIIAACADGRRAAEAICARLGIPFAQPPARMPRLSEDDILAAKRMRSRKETQVKPAMIPVSEHIDFRPGESTAYVFESTFTPEEARIEGLRCVQCAAFCDKCVEVCPNRANLTFRLEPARWTLPLLVCQDGALAVAGSEAFEIAQSRQILHVDDWCNECDNCQTFCIHHGRPYREKPRLFLDEDGFLAECDNAFRIEDDTIRRRERGQEARLAQQDAALVYEDARVRVSLTPEFEVKEMMLKEPFAGTLSLRPAAEMAVVLRGVQKSLPWLLWVAKTRRV
jgi:NADPH-dependent glutamate synthase beta subunit-like oxidoreductase